MSAPPMNKLVREAWLQRAITIIAKDLCTPHGVKLPEKLQVSCGFPFGSRGKRGSSHSIGQCWRPEASKNGTVEIFVHPELDGATRVLDVLVHEVIHASGVFNHGKDFKAVAVKFGLEGKMTATTASQDLKGRISDWLKVLPAYPHAGLDPHAGQGDGPKKQGTRMLKILCGACGWAARTSQKHIDAGLPTCACGEELGLEDEAGDGDED